MGDNINLFFGNAHHKSKSRPSIPVLVMIKSVVVCAIVTTIQTYIVEIALKKPEYRLLYEAKLMKE